MDSKLPIRGNIEEEGNSVQGSTYKDDSTGLIPVFQNEVTESTSFLQQFHQREPSVDKEEMQLQENLRNLLQPQFFGRFSGQTRDTEQPPVSSGWLPAQVIRNDPFRQPIAPRLRVADVDLIEAPAREVTVDPEPRDKPSSSPRPHPQGSHVTEVPLPNQQPDVQSQSYPPRAPLTGSKVTCSFGYMAAVASGGTALCWDQLSCEYDTVPSFQDSCKRCASTSSGLLVLVFENWQAWFLPILQDLVAGFPMETVLHLHKARATTMLPVIDIGRREISCIMEHVNTMTGISEKQGNGFNVGSTTTNCIPLVVWTSADGARWGARRPIIIIVSASNEVITPKITQHYQSSGYERWERLETNQIWIYLDLNFLFTRWDSVFGAIKQNIVASIKEIHSRHRSISIIEQTQQLHADNNVMINLREHLRIHRASLRVVMQRAKLWTEGGNPTENQRLHIRLDDAYQLLDYYDVTATSLLEQQQNLLSLAFNLETAIQGRAVARLNALAFIFLPLSLVATIFGITTLEVSPKWYPAAAIPVLIATVSIAWIVNEIFASTEKSPRAKMKASSVEDEERSSAVTKKRSLASSKFGLVNQSGNTSRFFSLFGLSTKDPHMRTLPRSPRRAFTSLGDSDDDFLGEPTTSVPLSTIDWIPAASTYEPQNRPTNSDSIFVPASTINRTQHNAPGRATYRGAQGRAADVDRSPGLLGAIRE